MTREERLYAMKGSELIKEADKLGVKVNCNKTRTQLSEPKSKAVEKILAAEAAEAAKAEEIPVEETPIAEEVRAEEVTIETPIDEPAVEETQVEEEPQQEGPKPTPKRGAPIEWNGKAQNICKWGEELGISPNTLYGRIYKMNWTIEKAFTTRPRK